ncbi:MAG TPA: hypothetical protein P5514_12600 [Bacteroidales bacterium]|nr:hypothetical protein [Bacteroidales bacterium]HRX97778.1 hypothetical protein [Bacteroidales bacterium]
MLISCIKEINNTEVFSDTATVSNGENLFYCLGNFGDVEGAEIKKQNSHYELSDEKRSENFKDGYYQYKAEAGYTGNDYVEIKIIWLEVKLSFNL